MLTAPASLGLLLARVPIGIYFAVAGYNKLMTVGARGFAEAQLASATRFMPESVARPWLTALPWVELVVGLMVVVGLGVRAAGLVMALLLVSFLVAATPVNLKLAGVTADASGPAFHANVIYLGLALGLMLAGGGRFGVDGLFVRRRTARLVRVDGTPAAVVVSERP